MKITVPITPRPSHPGGLEPYFEIEDGYDEGRVDSTWYRINVSGTQVEISRIDALEIYQAMGMVLEQ